MKKAELHNGTFFATENLFADFDEVHMIELRNYFIFTKVKLKQDFGKFKTDDVIPEVHLDGTRLHFVENTDNHLYDNSPDVNFACKLAYES